MLSLVTADDGEREELLAELLPLAREPRSMRSLLLGLTVLPQLGPLGATAKFSARALLAHHTGVPLRAGVPQSKPTLRLLSSVLVDEVMVHTMALAGAFLPMAQYEDAEPELEAAVRVFRDRGWIDAPGTYFSDPTGLPEVRVTRGQLRKGPVEELTFDSTFAPHPEEPGAARWASYASNKGFHATMLRHDGGPRPWLIALHGMGMGRGQDLDLLHLRRLHHELGLNVIVPVLPLNGVRHRGLPLTDGFASITSPMNNVFGMAQSVWELQHLITWLREEHQAQEIGVFGFSLGSYVASLLATREPDLACVIAVTPGVDLAQSLRENEPPATSRRLAVHRAVHDVRSALVHSVVSPLRQPCLVPRGRRFIIAGECDRVATPEGALALWHHWDTCPITWQRSGHLLTVRSPGFEDRLIQILRTSGMARA